MSLFTVVRWIHVLSAAAWLGEVVTVAFVLVPAAIRLTGGDRAAFISRVFPGVFRLASVLAAMTLAAGAWLNYLITGWRNLDAYFGSMGGRAILAGAFLGLALGLFHFIVESRLEPKASSLLASADEKTLEQISRFLTLVPRVGLGILLVILVLMMVGARGI
jgi:uncharacterized membrane protein